MLIIFTKNAPILPVGICMHACVCARVPERERESTAMNNQQQQQKSLKMNAEESIAYVAASCKSQI